MRHQFRGGDDVSQAPAGHGETLREAVNDQRALGHPGVAQHRNVFLPVNDAGVDFIRQHIQVMLHGEFGDAPLDFVGVEGTGRVAGRVEHNRLGARRDLRGDFVGIGLKAVALRESEGHGDAAESAGDRGICGESGIRREDFVARFEDGHHGHEERNLATGSDDHALRRDVQVACAVEVGGQLVFQCGDTGHRAIAVFAIPQRLFERGDHRFGRMEVRLPEFQMDDGSPLALKFLGARIDGERAFTAQNRKSGSQWSHGPNLIYTPGGAGVIGIRNASTKRGNSSKAAAVATSSTICGSVKCRFRVANNSSVISAAERCSSSAARNPSFSPSVNGPDS